jgi:superfamily II DNA or RNA helicase
VKLTPRPYQIESKRSVYRAFKEGARRVLVVMPTGTGKTVTFASIVADAVAQGKRVAILAHREELLDQAAEKIETLAGIPVAIEQGTRKQAGDDARVVIACVFSLIRRLDRFPADRFDLIIIDEAHRSLANTYRQLLAHFSSARVLGVTATPNRGDELALVQVYSILAYEMTPADAVLNGWLVPYRTVTIELQSLDLTTVRRRNGEFLAGELGAAMSEMRALREAVEPAVELAGHLRAIVFTCTVAHMHIVAETVRAVANERRLSLTVATVDGSTAKDERRQIMADYKSGKIRWLINVDIATEGFDAPETEAIIDMQPNEARSRFTQKKGRGARPLPGVVDGVDAAEMAVRLDLFMANGQIPTEPDPWLVAAIIGIHRGDDAAARRMAIMMSAKPECLVLDFTDNSGKFDLATEIDALGGDYELPVQREAQRLLADGGARHLLDALEQARAARAAKIREARARQGDPFAMFDIPFRQEKYGRPPTEKHQRIVAPLKIPIAELGWRQANDLCNELARREHADLSMYEQARLLAQLGCPVAWLPDMSRREASEMLGELAKDYWVRPKDWHGIRERSRRSAAA